MHTNFKSVIIMKQNKKVYAQGLCFDKIFLFFVLGSLFGSFFEEMQWFVQHGVWTSRHDLLIGPFSTLYGFGLILFLIILGPRNDRRGFSKTFIYAFLLGGIFEFIAGVLSEKIFNIQFWDYSSMFLNIQGKTTIPIMIIWGVMGVILLKIVYPVVSKWIEKIPYSLGKMICIILFLFISIDMALSYSVFGRMVIRHKGIEAKTVIGKFYDEKYNDEYMYNKYPILKGE